MDGRRVGQRMAGADEQFVGFVDDAGGFDRLRQLSGGRRDGVEGGVDRAFLDRGDGGVHVAVHGHDIQLDLRMRAVELVQEHGGRDPPVDDVDAQHAFAGPHGRVRPCHDPEQFAGVRQERLAVDGEPRATGRAREQPHAQVPLQPGHPFRHRLLADRQRVGRLLEPPGVHDGDEGAHGVEIHAVDRTRTTAGCGSPPERLFDLPRRPRL